jgi:hypothetical protein
MIARSVVVLLLVVAACFATATGARADAVWGTGLSYPASDPNYLGYWEYCFHIYWDTTEYGGQGLSHTTIYLGLLSCTCACDEGYFAFRYPAGVGAGEHNCEVYFYGEFDCPGDPHFPIPGPTVKFQPIEDPCEPGATGWVHVCYYSLFPPGTPGLFPDHIGIKFGQHVETGDLDGVLPYCDCPSVPVEQHTWGKLKSLYR